MPSLILVKTDDGKLRGMEEDDRRAQARLNQLKESMEPGELLMLEYRHPRNGRYHRKFMKMLRVAFAAWEPGQNRKRLKHKGMPIEKDFEKFREDIIIRAGFYRQVFDLKGRFTLEAQSISFASMDDVEFERVYGAVAQVLLQDILTTYSREDLDRVVEELLRFQEGGQFHG